MLIHSPNSRILVERWFSVLSDRADLLAASRYLVLGPEIASLLELPAPSAEEITDLLRTIRHDEEIAQFASRLADGIAEGREALLEVAVDELVAADDAWQHPSQVLPRPRPDLRGLLTACERRREASDGETEHLDAVLFKVKRAATIAEQARLTRERMRHGRRRKRPRSPPEPK